jgi:hypothetical protein
MRNKTNAKTKLKAIYYPWRAKTITSIHGPSTSPRCVFWYIFYANTILYKYQNDQGKTAGKKSEQKLETM